MPKEGLGTQPDLNQARILSVLSTAGTQAMRHRKCLPEGTAGFPALQSKRESEWELRILTFRVPEFDI